MPKFNAADIEDLEYDFTKFKAGKGVIPEPSEDLVDDFMKTVTKLMKEQGNLQSEVDPGDSQAVLAAMESMDDDFYKKANSQILEAVVKVCSESPSREQLDKLPYRQKTAFVGWIMDEFTNPEASPAATKPTPLRRVSGG